MVPIEIPESYLKGREHTDFFVMTISGNDLLPEYQHGDKLLILMQDTVNRSGDIGVVVYKNLITTLKRIEFAENTEGFRVLPVNSNSKSGTTEDANSEHYRIIGIPFLLIREYSE